ncbi:MAG: MraY family glycosyltransferase [Anaerolineae bacterium]
MPNARSSHVRPTPLGGGLGIVGTAVLGVAVAWAVFGGPPLLNAAAYLVAGLGIAAISWADDVHPLRASPRFAFHAAGALAVCAAFGWWRALELPGGVSLGVGAAGAVLAFVWCIGLTNAYNFMDGIDGLAGTQAVIAGLGWVAVGTVFGATATTYLGLMIAAASLGFLGHNWPPARIFMGDVGSAFLGYSFAALPLLFARESLPDVAAKSLFAGALMVWPFLFDSIFTFIRRLRRGEDVFAAHRSHLYQRLVISGLSHRAVTSLYGALAAVGAVLGVAWLRGLPWSGATAVATVVALSTLLWMLVRQRENPRSVAPSRGTGG